MHSAPATRPGGRLRLMSTIAVTCLVPAAIPQTSAPVTWRTALSQTPAWYATAEAHRVAGNLLLYQRRSGGWPKNIDLAAPLTETDRQQVLADKDRNDGTIDNGATTQPLRFLARVVHASPERVACREAFRRGMVYLLEAQYPNGGWPQTHPHPTGYQRHITFNDDAMVNVLTLLRDVAQGETPFDWLDLQTRQQAVGAVERGVDCILRCQILVDGRRTVWCAQHDRDTLAPAPARSYEKASLSGSESVGILRFLMSLPAPSEAVVAAVEDGVRWFRESALTGIRVVRRPDPDLPRGYDVIVVTDREAPRIWGRFHCLETNQPLFCGRDGVIKPRLADIEHERRVGYSWYSTAAERLLEIDYPRWRDRVR